MDATRLIFSTVVCGLGVVFGAVELLRRPRPQIDAAWARWDSPQGAIRRNRRRRLGAALIVLISLAFFLGVNFLRAARSGAAFLIFWIAVLIMIVWLCGLGIIDLVATRRVQRRMAAAIQEQLVESPVPPSEGAHEDNGREGENT